MEKNKLISAKLESLSAINWTEEKVIKTFDALVSELDAEIMDSLIKRKLTTEQKRKWLNDMENKYKNQFSK